MYTSLHRHFKRNGNLNAESCHLSMEVQVQCGSNGRKSIYLLTIDISLICRWYVYMPISMYHSVSRYLCRSFVNHIWSTELYLNTHIKYWNQCFNICEPTCLPPHTDAVDSSLYMPGASMGSNYWPRLIYTCWLYKKIMPDEIIHPCHNFNGGFI